MAQWLSLDGMLAFIEQCGGRSALQGKTTRDIKYEYLYGLTPHAVAARPELAPYLGPPTVFVSHAYGNLFLEAVDALIVWEAEARRSQTLVGPCHYYFDLLQNAQVEAPEGQAIPFEALRETFASNLELVKRTLVLIDWTSRLPLRSSWCMFELATSLLNDSSIEFLVPPGSQAAFLADLQADVSRCVEVLSSVDLRLCTAQEPRDQQGIQDLVQETVVRHMYTGVEALNALVNGCLREFMLQHARRHLEGPLRFNFSRNPPFTLAYIALQQSLTGYHDAAVEKHVDEVKGALYWSLAKRHSPTEMHVRGVLHARYLLASHPRFRDVQEIGRVSSSLLQHFPEDPEAPTIRVRFLWDIVDDQPLHTEAAARGMLAALPPPSQAAAPHTQQGATRQAQELSKLLARALIVQHSVQEPPPSIHR